MGRLLIIESVLGRGGRRFMGLRRRRRRSLRKMFCLRLREYKIPRILELWIIRIQSNNHKIRLKWRVRGIKNNHKNHSC